MFENKCENILSAVPEMYRGLHRCIKKETNSNFVRRFNNAESLIYWLITRVNEWLKLYSAVEFTWHWCRYNMQENFFSECSIVAFYKRSFNLKRSAAMLNQLWKICNVFSMHHVALIEEVYRIAVTAQS
jgi:maltose-binding protein MalE